MVEFNQLKVGILGGGQLGRMLLPSANYFDISISAMDPNPIASCAKLVDKFVVGDFNNYNDVLEFGRNVDVITIEIEHVNVEALYQLQSEGKSVFPQPRIIEIIQDKRLQKQFYQDNDIPTSPFVLIDDVAQLSGHADFLPAYQKLGKGGYDGAGVQKLATSADFSKAFKRPSLLEKAIEDKTEIAIIASRNQSGQIELFPTVEMVFHPEHNLVDYLIAPANISAEVETKAKEITFQLVEAFGLVGVLAVELFVTKDGEVLVNECAPRTHNSGHHTIHACNVSQFEQHLRAILNLPLAKVEMTTPVAAMVNLLGNADENGIAKIYGLHDAMNLGGVHPVFYGKKQTKPHRKMGHATITGVSKDEVIVKIDSVRAKIKIGI